MKAGVSPEEALRIHGGNPYTTIQIASANKGVQAMKSKTDAAKTLLEQGWDWADVAAVLGGTPAPTEPRANVDVRIGGVITGIVSEHNNPVPATSFCVFCGAAPHELCKQKGPVCGRPVLMQPAVFHSDVSGTVRQAQPRAINLESSDADCRCEICDECAVPSCPRR
jgi:hypothetical protein